MMRVCSVAVACAFLGAAVALAQEAASPQAEKPAEERKPADPQKTASKASTVDRLELDSTKITGNRELPKVLYVVPWKKSDLGDPSGPPAETLLDEVLAPVDRDVFRRQTRYFEQLDGTSGTDANPSEPDQAPPANEQ